MRVSGSEPEQVLRFGGKEIESRGLLHNMRGGFVCRSGMLSGLRKSAVEHGLVTSQAGWRDLESWSLAFRIPVPRERRPRRGGRPGLKLPRLRPRLSPSTAPGLPRYRGSLNSLTLRAREAASARRGNALAQAPPSWSPRSDPERSPRACGCNAPLGSSPRR